MNMLTPVEVLTKAKELISDKAQWTTGLYAATKIGDYVNPDSNQAVCWCAIGAIRKIGRGTGSGYLNAEVLLNDAARELYNDNAVEINDNVGHEAIMRVFDSAIEKGKQNGW